MKLFVDPLDVGVDGGDADGEFGGDFLLGETIDKLLEDLSTSISPDHPLGITR